MKFEIKHRYENTVLFSGEFGSLKLAVEAAVKSGADLSRADLSGAEGIEKQPPQTVILPAGDIIGWKKCAGGVIVKLLIPADAKRSNASGRKCRAEFVKVLKVVGGDVGRSDRGGEYRKGEIVWPDSWDGDWKNECSHGIHFFITREEAEAY